MRSEPRSARTPVWPLSLSLAATNKIDVSFSSSGYLDVSVHRVPFHTLWIGVWMTGVLPAGFPHSDICGSKIICISPQLFAAYHVFLRLLVPRHPPCALSCLTSYQLYFIALKYRVLRFKNAFGKFLYRFVMVYFLGCLDKKSFINLCMKFSRYQQHFAQWRSCIRSCFATSASFYTFKKVIHDFYHSSLSKKCFMTLTDVYQSLENSIS